jgi:hypothetical protein
MDEPNGFRAVDCLSDDIHLVVLPEDRVFQEDGIPPEKYQLGVPELEIEAYFKMATRLPAVLVEFW